MPIGRDVHTHNMASFRTRLKQKIILNTVKCYLCHLVSKVTQRIYLDCTKLRQKREGVYDLDGAIKISQSQIVKIKTPYLLTVEGEINHAAPL